MAAGTLVALVNLGCGPSDPQKAAPIAKASVEVLTLFSSNPDSMAAATCQTGAIVRLKATGSVDPEAQALTFLWTDRVDGELTPDFGPGNNPLVTSDPEIGVGLYRIGRHDVELTVRTRDGRKASVTLPVRVTSCEACGP